LVKNIDGRRHIFAVRRESPARCSYCLHNSRDYYIVVFLIILRKPYNIELHGNRVPSCWQTTIRYYIIVSNIFPIIYHDHIANIVTPIRTDVHGINNTIYLFFISTLCSVIYLLCLYILFSPILLYKTMLVKCLYKL